MGEGEQRELRRIKKAPEKFGQEVRGMREQEVAPGGG